MTSTWRVARKYIEKVLFILMLPAWVFGCVYEYIVVGGAFGLIVIGYELIDAIRKKSAFKPAAFIANTLGINAANLAGLIVYVSFLVAYVLLVYKMLSS